MWGGEAGISPVAVAHHAVLMEGAGGSPWPTPSHPSSPGQGVALPLAATAGTTVHPVTGQPDPSLSQEGFHPALDPSIAWMVVADGGHPPAVGHAEGFPRVSTPRRIADCVPG